MTAPNIFPIVCPVCETCKLQLLGSAENYLYFVCQVCGQTSSIALDMKIKQVRPKATTQKQIMRGVG